CEIQAVTIESSGFPSRTFDLLTWDPASPSPPLLSDMPHYWQKNQTAFEVPLPKRVGKGESVTVVLDFTLTLPQKQGRWGQWQGVTFLSNWHPVAAFYDDQGWHPSPFIPWHQPFFNEAGSYHAKVTLPAKQQFGCTGTVRSLTDLGNGMQQAEIAVSCARDFAFLCSDRFREFIGQIDSVHVRVLAFAEHEHHAREMVRIALEAIPVYNKWFGPYPYPEFTIVESYFGWNGNECSGLVMIDERVFNMPHLASGFVDYLVSHEICHQWWYNVVGTNGYEETWMDEGLATYFSHRLLNLKTGSRNNQMLKYPTMLGWMPNINRATYRNYGFYGTLGRGEAGPIVQPIDKFDHVVNLFSMCYDKGSKIVGMIEDRLGEQAFFDFMHHVYRKYYFGILRVADFQRELEDYSGYSWEEFFKNWLYGSAMTDWAVEKVTIEETAPPAKDWKIWHRLLCRSWPETPCRATVIVRQKGPFTEQTVLGFRLDNSTDYQVRIPIVPQAEQFQLEDPPTRVQCLPDNRVLVEVVLPCRPRQIAVDPDQLLPDLNPTNNYWKPEFRFRLTPLYTLLEETDLTTAYDRWNIIAGPWIFGTAYDDPWYTRSMMGGFRVGLYRTQQVSGGVYAAYRTDYRDIVAGMDALIDHWPWSHFQVGMNVERSLTALNDERFNHRAVGFGRYVFQYGDSLYLPPMHYLEGFSAIEFNDLPLARHPVPGSERYDKTTNMGFHYHLDYLTPYWDPEGGFKVDATLSEGLRVLGNKVPFTLLSGQFSWVKGLPDGLGWFSDTRLAARVYGGIGFPTRGDFFPLGGAGLFRGFDLAERQGSMVWVGSMEWRFPIVKGLNWNICDRGVGLRGISGVTFYDVGNAYVSGHPQGNVAHAAGGGFAFDVAWFSFVERTTIRLDVGQSLNSSAPLQFNFYFQHPF
ncbi:MAG TPA: M1 family aminopeptidase, partial [Gemmataceae bacterium]|nr:M1 family aminopeptidase [Gemmataceae bacterium]